MNDLKKYLSVIIISLFSVCWGQEADDYSLLRNIRDNGYSYRFFVAPFQVKENGQFNTDEYYYWFKSQKIQKTQGGASGQLLHGHFESFYFNKQLAEKGQFKNGQKDGLWNYWYDNGALKLTEEWKSGSSINKSIYRNEAGNIIYTIDRKLFKTIYLSEGKTVIASKDSSHVKLIEYAGTLKKSELKTKKGKLNGKQFYYDSLGEVSRVENYKNGIRTGKQVIEKDSIVFYKDGEPLVDEKLPKKEKPLKADKNNSDDQNKVKEKDKHKKSTSESDESEKKSKVKKEETSTPKKEKKAEIKKSEEPIKEKEVKQKK